jgi:hypothetical protein
VTAEPVRTRSFVMVLVGWCALAAAPVVALTQPPVGAFCVLALGLIGASGLRFSLRVTGTMAAVCTIAFVLAEAVGPVSPWTLTADDMSQVARSLVHPQTLVPDLLAAAAFAGASLFGELASDGLEWHVIVRRLAAEPRRWEEELLERPALEPQTEFRFEPPAEAEPANGTAPKRTPEPERLEEPTEKR